MIDYEYNIGDIVKIVAKNYIYSGRIGKIIDMSKNGMYSDEYLIRMGNTVKWISSVSIELAPTKINFHKE